MSKKRYLAIIVTIGLLFIIGTIFTIKQVTGIRLGRSQLIEVCRDALLNTYGSDRPGYIAYPCGDTVIYSPLKYKRIKVSALSATVYFDDGTNDMWCDMQRRGSEWVVTSRASTIVGMCP